MGSTPEDGLPSPRPHRSTMHDRKRASLSRALTLTPPSQDLPTTHAIQADRSASLSLGSVTGPAPWTGKTHADDRDRGNRRQALQTGKGPNPGCSAGGSFARSFHVVARRRAVPWAYHGGTAGRSFRVSGGARPHVFRRNMGRWELHETAWSIAWRYLRLRPEHEPEWQSKPTLLLLAGLSAC